MSSGQDEGGFKRRQGQKEWREYLERHAANGMSIFAGRQPTGYGKTESIIDGYDCFRHRLGCNRVLIVVPTTTQEIAYAKELHTKAKAMRIPLSGVVVADSAARTFRYHRQNQAEVYIVTIQRLWSAVTGRNARGNWLVELIETGRWCGAADEYHHYADDNSWGQVFRQLPSITPWMALSATPERRQGEPIFGKPVVNISYQAALEEKSPEGKPAKILKDVQIKIREYGVDMQVAGGEVLTRTTTELREEINTEGIDEWEARKQLRYLTKYCSPIIGHGLAELNYLRNRAPRNAQPVMLVYAFSCAHAQSLCRIIGGAAPGLRVDWAGTGPNGRLDAENDKIIDAFKRGDLDVLVQVNIASEGFNCPAICVILDLSLTGFSPQKLQAYGRGTRWYFDLPLTIFIPTDSNMASLAQLRAGIFDLPVDTIPPREQCDCCPLCPRCIHHPWEPKTLPSIHVLNALLIGGEDYVPSREEVYGVAARMNQKPGFEGHFDVANNEEHFNIIRDALREYQQANQRRQSEAESLAYWIGRVKTSVGVLAYNVLMSTIGSVEKSALADICKRINSRWIYHTHRSHDAMTSADFQEKHQWLDTINQDIIKGRVPPWLA
jgi:hypothetical protein